MTRVIRYQTSDGQLHDTVQKARHHADVRYTDAVCKIAAEIIKIDKYQYAKDFIALNLPEFVRLQALRDDMELINPEEEE